MDILSSSCMDTFHFKFLSSPFIPAQSTYKSTLHRPPATREPQRPCSTNELNYVLIPIRSTFILSAGTHEWGSHRPTKSRPWSNEWLSSIHVRLSYPPHNLEYRHGCGCWRLSTLVRVRGGTAFYEPWWWLVGYTELRGRHGPIVSIYGIKLIYKSSWCVFSACTDLK